MANTLDRWCWKQPLDQTWGYKSFNELCLLLLLWLCTFTSQLPYCDIVNIFGDVWNNTVQNRVHHNDKYCICESNPAQQLYIVSKMTSYMFLRDEFVGQSWHGCPWTVLATYPSCKVGLSSNYLIWCCGKVGCYQ